MGSDHTLYALENGIVMFKHDGRNRSIVTVETQVEA